MTPITLSITLHEYTGAILYAFLRSDSNRRPKECSLYAGIDDIDLLKADRRPSISGGVYYNISVPKNVRNVALCSKTKDTFDGLYLPALHRGASKGHGIIRINLNKVHVGNGSFK